MAAGLELHAAVAARAGGTLHRAPACRLPCHAIRCARQCAGAVADDDLLAGPQPQHPGQVVLVVRRTQRGWAGSSTKTWAAAAARDGDGGVLGRTG